MSFLFSLTTPVLPEIFPTGEGMSLILNSLVEITLEPSSKVAIAEILVVKPFFGTREYFPLLVFDIEDLASVLTFTLLSDAKMELARKMGIAFKMNKKTLIKYKTYGINLEKASGEDHFQLPAPAVFVLDKEGTIQMSYVNPNYKVRLNAKALVAVLKSMN